MPKRKSRPKTPEQILKAADAHRQKKYGVGLDYYVSQLEKQGGGCGICESPPGTRRLHIDHDHSWTRVRVVSSGNKIHGWFASAVYHEKGYSGFGKTKSKAISAVKIQLKKASVRGLLCYRCNSGLQKYGDKPRLFRAAAEYLERHQGTATNGRRIGNESDLFC